MTPEDIQSLIIYRDAMILVLNKPSGIPVHQGSGKFRSLDRDFKHLQFGLPRQPELAHRLDKDTSGCLVLGRHPEALRRLGKMFEGNLIEKTYHALVYGVIEQDEGDIDLPIGKQSQHSTRWWSKVDHENGKPALTHFRVLRRFEQYTYVALSPKTGRTHQLRVHMQALGHPIVGDKIYGGDGEDKKLHLHAHSLTIPLYPKKDPLLIEAALPEHMTASLATLS